MELKFTFTDSVTIPYDRAELSQLDYKLYRTDWEKLSYREQQVAALAAQNFTNRMIAGRLGISPETTKTHMGHILKKIRAAK